LVIAGFSEVIIDEEGAIGGYTFHKTMKLATYEGLVESVNFPVDNRVDTIAEFNQ
jgi:hypothetical protein